MTENKEKGTEISLLYPAPLLHILSLPDCQHPPPEWYICDNSSMSPHHCKNPLCFAYLSFSPANPWQPVIFFYYLHSLIFSRISYSWNHRVCHLFRLASSAYHSDFMIPMSFHNLIARASDFKILVTKYHIASNIYKLDKTTERLWYPIISYRSQDYADLIHHCRWRN